MYLFWFDGGFGTLSKGFQNIVVYGADVVLSDVGGEFDTSLVTIGRGSVTAMFGDGYNVARTGMGDDVLVGGHGGNYLSAGGGDDILAGGNGSDLLEGGNGSDMILFGETDVVFGGKGADFFVFTPNPLPEEDGCSTEDELPQDEYVILGDFTKDDVLDLSGVALLRQDLKLVEDREETVLVLHQFVDGEHYNDIHLFGVGDLIMELGGIDAAIDAGVLLVGIDFFDTDFIPGKG